MRTAPFFSVPNATEYLKEVIDHMTNEDITLALGVFAAGAAIGGPILGAVAVAGFVLGRVIS